MTAVAFTTAADAVRFAYAGKAHITVRSKVTGDRFTFRVRVSSDGKMHFVSLLTGSDNESSYSYIGYIRRGVFFHGGAKAKVAVNAKGVLAFKLVWMLLQQDILPNQAEIFHEGRCGRCARLLTVPESIASGLGPECAGKSVFLAEAV